MVAVFEEIEDIIPRNTFIALLAVFVATSVFMLICTMIESINTPIWMFVVTTVIFSVMTLACYFIKMKVRIEDDIVHIQLIKHHVIPFGDIIDHKIGDIDIIRNYSGWGFKNVKFKNMICAGYDEGVSLKVIGRMVITFSVSNPEHFVSLLPVPEKAE
jgi:hypothetical protein